MSSNQDQRPRFFQGQYLGAEDLSAAVDYSRAQMARHALGAHSWGIATGLQLKEKNLAGGRIEIYVLPGYGWDGFGRPITLLAPYKIPTELFKPYVFDPAIDNATPEGRLIEVWLRYDEGRTRNVRPGFEVCDIEDQNSRVQETFRVEVGARTNHIDRHNSIMVAGNPIDAQEVIQKFDPHSPPVSLYDESVPYQDLPETDTKTRWLIPLGYVRWKPNPNPNQSGNFIKRNDEDLKASRSLRRYIGVVAEWIQAADGILRMRDRTKPYSLVQSDDLVWVEGNLRVEGDMRPFGGKLDFRHIDGRDFDIPLKIQRSGDPGPGSRALQIIVGPKEQTNNRFAVGPLKADKSAVDEKFVVLSGGNVGIGTTAPSHIFHVRANEAVGLFESTSTQAYLRLATSEGLSNRVEITNRPGGRLSLFTSGAGDALNITRDGNVGIGTIAPSHIFHVRANEAVGLFESTSTQAYLRLATSEGLNNRVEITNRPGGRLSLFTSGAGDALNITRNGNVGIGTTTPALKLDIQGDFGRNNGPTTLHLFGSQIADTNNGILSLRSGGAVVAFDGNDKIGIGLNVPVCRLHVVDSINADAANIDAHVAVIENTNMGNTADVLALKVGINPAAATPGNNFVTFFAGNSIVGQIENNGSSGVSFVSGNADFAEYLPRLFPDECLNAGDIVGVFGGKITKHTEGAHHVTAITNRPIVLANVPSSEKRHLHGKAAFIGQVNVKVRGAIREGDFIVPSGLNDGTGIAISPDGLWPDQSTQIVGRAWESSDEEGLKIINTVIGLPSSSPYAAHISLLKKQQEQIEVLKAEMKKLRQKVEKK